MKKLFVLLVVTLVSYSVNAQYYKKSYYTPASYSSSYYTPAKKPAVTYQSTYTRSNGTVVSGHYKTTADYTNRNNYSTVGNVNPYTGSIGSRAADYTPGALNYGSGKTIHTGSRGGQYYYNSYGNKVYVPKR